MAGWQRATAGHPVVGPELATWAATRNNQRRAWNSIGDTSGGGVGRARRLGGDPDEDRRAGPDVVAGAGVESEGEDAQLLEGDRAVHSETPPFSAVRMGVWSSTPRHRVRRYGVGVYGRGETV